MSAKKKKTTPKKGKNVLKKTLPEIIIAVVLILVIGLYYYSIPPFSFDLGIGLKYKPREVKPPVKNTEGNLTMTMINVGQGDSVLLELPDGKTMLIDGGKNGTFGKDSGGERFGIAQAILDVLAGKDITELDYVLLTHTDSDHCGSLDDVINSDSVLVHTVYMPYVKSGYADDPLAKGKTKVSESLGKIEPQSISTRYYDAFVESVVKEGSEIVYSEAGTVIEGEGYRMTFVTPDPSQYSGVKSGDAKAINNVSPIILLEYPTVRVMLTGDAAKKGEQVFLDNYVNMGLDVDVDVLKAGHHGSKESSNSFFLDVIKPEYVVISAGYGNTYNHPEKETLDRFAAIGAEVHCTIDCGTITMKADKNGFGFECEKIKATSCVIVDPFGITARFALFAGRCA